MKVVITNIELESCELIKEKQQKHSKMKRDLLIGVQNIRSVNGKETDIYELINELNLDVLCLTETWLTGSSEDNIHIAAMIPYNFTFFHIPRKFCRGGGVGAVIKKNMCHVTICNRDQSEYVSFEYVEILLKFSSKLMRLIVLYRSPSQSINIFIEEFYEFMDVILKKDGVLILAGDFNIHVNDMNNKDSSNFKEILDAFNLVNHVYFPTHRLGNSLDLVITEKCDIIKRIHQNDTFKLSDHHLVLFEVKMKNEKYVERKTIRFRNISSINMDAFCKDMNQLLSDEMKSVHEVSDLVNTYNLILTSILEKHAPLKTRSINLKHGEVSRYWFNSEVKKLRCVRRKCERTWRRLKTLESKEMFIIARNNVIKQIKIQKVDYFRKIFEHDKQNSRKIFSTLNTLFGKDNALCNFENEDEISNKFLNFFMEKIDRIKNEMLSTVTECYEPAYLNNFNNNFRFVNVTYENIKKIIVDNKCTTCRNDPIPSILYKNSELLDILIPFVSKIVNESLSTGSFPESEKCAIVRPLLKNKSGDTNDLSNYRPISNLSFLSKIIEKVIAVQLTKYLEENNILTDFQSAYRDNFSTETAVLKINNDIICGISKGKCVLSILLDLSAAFDTVNHTFLLNDLRSIGISEDSMKWFDSYISKRTQVVVVNDILSRKNVVNCGVPQGSILGPILFLIYIDAVKNIFNKSDYKYHIYADDIQIYIEFESDESQVVIKKLESFINQVIIWMKKKHLKINEKKTECIVFGSKRNIEIVKSVNNKISIGKDLVQLKGCVKNIGFIFDENMTLNNQINNTIKVCNFQLRRISKIRRFLDKDTTC
ncbi:MAG TPA: hypothetical protein DDZ39_03320, partial [Flavobacteriaceae bacterium]|nr:hypothetical protein [Flavobacteriaceae bacterium]